MEFQNKVKVIKLYFFNTAVGDIFKCIDGEALVAAFLQCFCIIDYTSFIRNKLPRENNRNRENYIVFVNDFLKKINQRYNREQLYAIRCALVHTYGRADAMQKAKLTGYSFTHRDPKLHLEYQNFILHLDLSIFSCDVVEAVWSYFSSLYRERNEKKLFDPVTRGEQLIKVYDSEGKIELKSNYGQIHSCLSPLNLGNWQAFRQKVYDLCLSK